MTDPNIAYLERDDISGVIAKGLAVLYLENPKFPIDYLAKWLFTYAKNQQIKSSFIEDEKNCNQLKQKELQRIKHEEEQKVKEQEKAEKEQQEELDFQQTIIGHEYHDELIQKTFCDYLRTKLDLSGVYIAEMDFPRKDVQLDKDDDEGAHFDANAPKSLRYMAASQNQKFMIDRTLALETGFTYEALKELPPDDNGAVPINTGVYVPDVVKDTRIYFHQWPKLGAFLAVPLIYQSCLQESYFDACVEARQLYLKARDEQRKEREAKELEFEEQIAAKQEQGEDTLPLETELKNYRESLEEVKETPFQVIRREFVLCCDTLGLDREIPEATRTYVFQTSNLLSKSWEERERQALSDDIDRQLKYIEQIPNPKELIDQYLQDEEGYIEANIEKFEDVKEKNEKEFNYEVECLRLEKMKEQLTDKVLIQPLLSLNESRLVKFPGILQALLYLLQFDKLEVNLPGTNILNWKHARTLLTDSLLDRIIAYSHKGPKEVPRYPWSLVNRVQRKLEKYEQDQVDLYCLPYGRLLRILNITCKLRKLDIEIRRSKIEQKRNLILTLKAEVATLQEERLKQLQLDKEQIPPEDLEAFSQEEWDANWDAEHPLPEIPENPEDEIDGDYEFDLQQ